MTSEAERRVNLLASLKTPIGKLVRPAVQATPSAFIAHRNFLVTRLAVSLVALVAAPVCLAVGEAPAWWQAGALAWLLLPAAAVAIVSRSGDLIRGESLSLVAWLGLAATMTLGSGSTTGLGLLLMVPLEVALASTPMTRAGVVATGAAVVEGLALPLATRWGPAPSTPLIVWFGAAITAGAAIYGLVLGLLASRLKARDRREMLRSQGRYRDLAEAIDDLPLRLDGCGMVLSAGAAAARLFGIDPQDLVGRGLFERVHVGDRPAFLNLVADAAAKDARLSAVVRLRSGATVPSRNGAFCEPVFVAAELQVRRETTQESAATILFCLMTDVSARVDHEAALAQAAEAARKADDGRTLFLANVSHELRTPLNAIIGFADLLSNAALGPRDPDKQREYASIILQSGHHLLAVVNTILDASKIEAGSFSIVPESFDLARLVHGCCDMVGLKAEAGAIEIVRSVAGDFPDIVGDERAYKQILLNLLSNAIKFTPGGGRIGVSARLEGTSVILAVADNGIGVSAPDLQKLGAPFFQAQSAYDRAFEGTGLGLSVVRGLVNLHGGSIAIESAPGQGMRVAVRLPRDCRAHLDSGAKDTKIETIPRYIASIPRAAGPVEFARTHKIA